LPAAALTTDVAALSALANDISFDVVFARLLAANGRAGDVAVGLSTSGGSANVLRGFEEATRRGMLTVGLAGYDGGKMAEASTIERKNATSPGIRMHGGRLGARCDGLRCPCTGACRAALAPR
jgi:phosphoheptose isomerase